MSGSAGTVVLDSSSECISHNTNGFQSEVSSVSGSASTMMLDPVAISNKNDCYGIKSDLTLVAGAGPFTSAHVVLFSLRCLALAFHA